MTNYTAALDVHSGIHYINNLIGDSFVDRGGDMGFFKTIILIDFLKTFFWFSHIWKEKLDSISLKHYLIQLYSETSDTMTLISNKHEFSFVWIKF